MARNQIVVFALIASILGFSPVALAQESGSAGASGSSGPHQITLAKPIRGAGHWGIGFGGGLGVSGISVKYYFSSALAIQGIIGGWGWGYCYGGNCYAGGFGVDADLLFELPTLAKAGNAMDLNWEIGPGAWLGVSGAPVIAVSGVLGLELDFIPVPIDLVFEYKPALVFWNPGVGFSPVGFGSHIRIFFQ